MSSYNLTANLSASACRALLGSAVILAGTLALSGCQVRPLYGTSPNILNSNGSETTLVQDELAAIDVKVSLIGSNNSSQRVDQYMSNELQYLFRRGGSGLAQKYDLEVLIDTVQTEVGVEELSDVPSAYNITLSASFVLSDASSEKTLYVGRSFGSASYDFSNQRFANLRAERDAENRATKIVASDIQARIAGYFATDQ
ncbi:LPS assembly lipoprotein LptE [Flexibacterium corallicola]|uniref:LPS assembly lipoprotein LptE n=1 Tax=Flexibacterium corallicola TaxID=3037259 RepID=UPI00286F6FC8|nr:LPS assembly lipoprotein LptE [Pseudovibrio sp. M1P-2-3]